jgi:NAD(P)H dehydrogenase (quinone)
MNVLIVTAHPKDGGHTHVIAETYKREVEKLGHTVKVVDLYARENQLPFYALSRDPNQVVANMQQDVLWAKEIVMIHPIWWSQMPAIMKNWMDTVFTPGFAYKYYEGKPKKLLTGKTAKIFATAGSYAPYYHIPIVYEFTPLHIIWKYAFFGFFGVDLIDFKICDQMNVNDSCPPIGCFENYLEKIKKSAQNIH